MLHTETRNYAQRLMTCAFEPSQEAFLIV